MSFYYLARLSLPISMFYFYFLLLFSASYRKLYVGWIQLNKLLFRILKNEIITLGSEAPWAKSTPQNTIIEQHLIAKTKKKVFTLFWQPSARRLL